MKLKKGDKVLLYRKLFESTPFNAGTICTFKTGQKNCDYYIEEYDFSLDSRQFIKATKITLRFYGIVS